MNDKTSVTWTPMALPPRPTAIPDHAEHVLQLDAATWLWEFLDGAVVYLGRQPAVGEFITWRLQGNGWAQLVHTITTNADRYRAALAAQAARDAAYDDYLSGVDYDADDEAEFA